LSYQRTALFLAGAALRLKRGCDASASRKVTRKKAQPRLDCKKIKYMYRKAVEKT
jgi:hypothetical protein